MCSDSFKIPTIKESIFSTNSQMYIYLTLAYPHTDYG